MNLAAKLSKGIGLDEDMQVSEPMNIIYQTAEDGLADTVKPTVYITLLTSGKLNSYLADIEEQAQEHFERIVEQMKQVQEITEQLKAENQMEWVARTNNIQSCAREIVENEILY